MICPKCGRKYEDDMPQCLWCDAPNPKMKKQPEPKPALEPTKEFELEPVQKIPADSKHSQVQMTSVRNSPKRQNPKMTASPARERLFSG